MHIYTLKKKLQTTEFLVLANTMKKSAISAFVTQHLDPLIR